MEAWVCIAYVHAKTVAIEMQNENAVVIMAKELTTKVWGLDRMFCVNQNDGTVLYFAYGKMVDHLSANR